MSDKILGWHVLTEVRYRLDDKTLGPWEPLGEYVTGTKPTFEDRDNWRHIVTPLVALNE